jgi:hypothetical protein
MKAILIICAATASLTQLQKYWEHQNIGVLSKDSPLTLYIQCKT